MRNNIPAVRKKDETRLWTKQFILLFSSAFLISFSNNAFANSLTVYLEKMTDSVALSGLSVGAFCVVALVVRPIGGKLTDKYGPYKLLVISAAVAAFACFCHLAALTVVIFLLCRMLHGLSFSLFTTASTVTAAGIIPRSRFNEGIGYFSIASVLASAIGPWLALWIIGDYDIHSFQILFLLVAGGCLLSSIMCAVGGVGGSVSQDQALRQSQTSTVDLPKAIFGFERGVLWPCVILILMFACYGTQAGFLQLYANSNGWGNVGPFFAVYAASSLLTRLFSGKIADRCGADIIAIPGMIIGILSFSAIAMAPSLFMLCLSGILSGLFVGIMSPVMNVAVIRRCSRERRGSAAAAYYAAMDIGVGIGSIATGFSISLMGYRATFLMDAGLCAVAMLLYTLTITRAAEQKHGLKG